MTNVSMPEIEKMAPATGRQGAPASGTYGEGAQLDDLKAQLPPMEQHPEQSGAATAPLPPMGGPMPQPAPSGGLPAGIMSPSRRPSEPVGTPLSLPPPMGTTGPEQRIQMLQAIVNDPTRDPVFREWAQGLLDGYTQ